MDAIDFTDIIKGLLEENNELKRQVEMMEEILRCHLPIIEKEK